MRLPSRHVLAAVYLACGALAGAISYGFGQSRNLEVFRHAARALLAGRDLYDGSSVDWFKYSPTFALLFAPLAWLPGWVAAVLWGALNFGAAFVGLEAAALGDDRRARVAALAALPGILLATDGDQANLLVGGAILVAFASFERGRSSLGAVAVAVGALVKLFPIAAALFALPHAERERGLFRVIVVLAVGGVLPLAVLAPGALGAEYASWFALLRADHRTRGWSVVTVVRDLGGSASAVQIVCCALLALPFVVAIVVPTDASYRRRAAAALLVLVVLANHRSEYASFVLCAMGVGLWFADGRLTAPRVALLVLATVAHGPLFVRDDPVLTGPLSFLAAHRLFHPLRLVPFVLVWLGLQVSLLRHVRARVERGRTVSA